MNAIDNDHPLPDQKSQQAQKAHSLLQTIQTLLPALPATPDNSVTNDEEDFDYGRAGKVARLPADVRETVNLMLHDNIPYATIIERLASLGYPGFNPTNITRWKQRGYLEWLYHRFQAENTRLSAKAHLDLLKQITPEELQSVHKLVDFIFADKILAAFARLNPSQMTERSAAEILSAFGRAIARQSRERTRSDRLLLATRRLESAASREEKSQKKP